MLDRVVAPKFQNIEQIRMERPKTHQLSNGAKVHFLNSADLSALKLEVVFKAGAWHESLLGESSFSTILLREGTVHKTASEISFFFDKYGAFLELNSGIDTASVSVYCLDKHFAKILPIVLEILFEPSFDSDSIERQKTKKKQQVKLNKSKGNIRASQLFRQSIFGKDHPYGSILLENHIDQIDREILQEFHQNYFLQTFDIFLTGYLSDEIKSLVTDSFSVIGTHSIRVNRNSRKIESINHLTEQKESSLQSSIRLGKRLFNRSHNDFNHLQVANHVLGGFFGSRLMKNIREDKGYTYGIYSSIIPLHQEGYFVIGSDVKKESTHQAIAEILKEIDILATEPIASSELELIKSHLLGSFLNQINNPFDLMDKFKAVYFEGLSYESYNQFIHTVNNITADEVCTLVEKYFNSLDLTTVIVGDSTRA